MTGPKPTGYESPNVSRETIFALASASGRAGVSVVRVSGPAAGPALKLFTAKELPLPREANLSALINPENGDAIDKALTLWFPGPASFTGEDIVEFHVHGGPAILEALFEALGALDDMRPAEAGEFTRRAFENGKLDLTEAEGLADLIEARTSAQRRQALRQMEGALGDLYEDWRSALISILANLEADIDFPDEDLPEGLAVRVRPQISDLRQQIEAHLRDGHRGEQVRDGLVVVIVGAPNVGKSSLMNLLARRDVAIVTEEAGTTRDAIEVSLNLGGYPVILIDTAGLRAAEGQIEQEGIRRARQRAASADLKIAMIDGARAAETFGAVEDMLDQDSILLINKSDLDGDEFKPRQGGIAGSFGLSVKTGEGVSGFLDALADQVSHRLAPTEAPVLSRVRHRQALEECCSALLRFEQGAGAEAELAAEDIRLAARALGRITGRIDVEDILDKVFGDFCIGK